MLLVALTSCISLEHTGPTGMVGRILDSGGQPLADLRVSSIEADARTDPAGRFAVAYRHPEQHIRFQWGPVAVTRRYAATDDGKELVLQLPAIREVRVACPPEPCDLTARWSLGEGFEATFRTRCREAGTALNVSGMPVGVPDMSCSVGKGLKLKVLDLQVADSGAVLGFRPRGTQVHITISGDPNACAVSISGRAATLAGTEWQGEAEGAVVVSAVCDGVPARPVWLDSSVTHQTELTWNPTPPTITAPPGSLQLVAEGGQSAGWSIPIPRPASGPVAIPPLLPGTYRLIALPKGTVEAMLAPPPEPTQGTLEWTAQADGSSVGRLVLESEVQSGTIPQ